MSAVDTVREALGLAASAARSGEGLTSRGERLIADGVSALRGCERAEAALREYANPDNWEADNDFPFLGTWIKTTDPTKIAREALARREARKTNREKWDDLQDEALRREARDG